MGGYFLFELGLNLRASSFALRSCHMGRGRSIVDPHPKFHVTVQKRMKSALNYKPKAVWMAGTEVYVH